MTILVEVREQKIYVIWTIDDNNENKLNNIASSKQKKTLNLFFFQRNDSRFCNIPKFLIRKPNTQVGHNKNNG